MLKKEVFSLLLSEKLDTLTVCTNVKAILRATLSTVGAYRLAMGEPHLDTIAGAILESKPTEQIDITWRGALGVVGKMFLELVEAGCKIMFTNTTGSAVSRHHWN